MPAPEPTTERPPLLRTIEVFPLLMAAAFLLLVVVSINELRAGIYDNADIATAPVFAEALGRDVPGRTILLGDSPWYEPLWILRATAWLPGRNLIWQLYPFLVWLASAGLAFQIVRRSLVDARLAAVAAALVLTPGLSMRGIVWVPNSHGMVVPHALLLMLAVVAVLDRPAWLHGRRLAIGGGLLVLVTAVGATDQMVVLYGLVPLLAVAALQALRTGSARVFAVAGGLSVLSVAGAKLAVALGEGAGIVATGRVFDFVTIDKLPRQVSLLVEAVAQLVGKSPFGQSLDAAGAALLGAGLLAFVGCAVVLRGALRSLGELIGRAGAVVAGEAAGSGDGDGDGSASRRPVAAGLDTREALLLFAGTAALLALGIWLFTGLVFDLSAVRYIAPVWPLAIVALAVAYPSGAGRAVVVLAALVITATATSQFARDRATWPGLAAPSEADASAIRAFAAEHGVTHGFGAYWDAAAVTWHTRFDLRIAPVLGCQGTANCRYYLGTDSAAFAPKGGPTLLLTDAKTANQPNVDPAYGKPVAQRAIGIYTVRIYARDLAPLIRQQ